jgi:hypothetical protein
VFLSKCSCPSVNETVSGTATVNETVSGTNKVLVFAFVLGASIVGIRKPFILMKKQLSSLFNKR